MTKYIFNAVFTYDYDGISINFPDLPGCISCGFSTNDAIQMAKEALELYLEGMQDDEIPQASTITEIEIDALNKKVFPIEVGI